MISLLREIAYFKPCSRIWDPGSKLALESFGNGARFLVLLPRHSSPDFTLNCLSRPLSLPDSKFLRQIRGGSCTENLATLERLRESADPRNHPLSALISFLVLRCRVSCAVHMAVPCPDAVV